MAAPQAPTAGAGSLWPKRWELDTALHATLLLGRRSCRGCCNRCLLLVASPGRGALILGAIAAKSGALQVVTTTADAKSWPGDSKQQKASTLCQGATRANKAHASTSFNGCGKERARPQGYTMGPALRSGLLLKEAQLPKSGAGSGGGGTSDGGVTGKLNGSAQAGWGTGQGGGHSPEM